MSATKQEKKVESAPPRVVSLLSGAGGTDLGFLEEGFEVVWANDIDHDACRTYRHNLGEHRPRGFDPQTERCQTIG